MTGVRKGISAVLVLTFILLSLGVLFAPPVDAWYVSTASDTYVYPVDPDATRKSWREPASHRERARGCRLPREILNSISTEGLVESCVKYPMLDNFTFFKNPYEGVVKTLREFNGLQELLYEREDAAQALLAFYQGIDLGKMRRSCPDADTQYAYIEMLLSEHTILEKMSRTERLTLLKTSLENQNSGELDDLFTSTGFSQALLVGRILAMDSDVFGERLTVDTNLRSFIQDGNLFAVTNDDWNRHLVVINGIVETMTG